MSDLSVWVVVLTHNRIEMLERCLLALQAQTRRLDGILVVDNASSDGTASRVRERFEQVTLLALEINQQCAGGYHEGLKAAVGHGAEWIWLLDDDAIARPDALAELLGGLERAKSLRAPALLAGKVVWDDGRLHPMNVPGFERSDLAAWTQAAERALLPIRSSTFVSLFVSRAAVERHGLPYKHYVIYGDDIEFTARILRSETGYLAPASVVHHMTETPRTASSSSGGRFYYHVRNIIYMLRGPVWSRSEKLSLGWSLITTSLAYVRHNSFGREPLLVVLRGLRDGLRTPPQAQGG